MLVKNESTRLYCMEPIFPDEIICQLARDRRTTQALRCVCRRFVNISAHTPWPVDIIFGTRNRWLEHAFAGMRRVGNTHVFADGIVVAEFTMRKWRRDAARLCHRVAYEYILAGQNPVIPYDIEDRTMPHCLVNIIRGETVYKYAGGQQFVITPTINKTCRYTGWFDWAEYDTHGRVIIVHTAPANECAHGYFCGKK